MNEIMTSKTNLASLPQHPFFSFKETKDRKHYEITITDIPDKDLEHDIRGMMNANLKTEKKDRERIWILEKKDIENFLEAIEELQKDEEEEEEEEEEDSDSSTDDELIQKALARRMKSESSSDIIDEDHISDSEMEDVLSLSRRLRYIISRVQRLETKFDKYCK